MKTTYAKLLMLILTAAIGFTACKKDNKVEENQGEVITTLQLSLVPVTGGTPVVFQFDDVDGPGGTAPTKDEIVLAANQAYNVAVKVLNKTTNPVEDITMEIEEESATHRFYYLPGTGSNITVTNFNNDVNGIPLGTTSTWISAQPGGSTLRVVLRHYPGTPPNKAAGDPVDSPKSGTDIDINFVTRVE